MKSLKRTLCLVLALVMVLGLFGVASAASFTDTAAIQYNEAVGVMTGIGAINGIGDGSFAPKGTITRAQAAKLVAYTILGSEVVNTGTAVSSFSDVPAAQYSWAIPSIEYLVQKGIINGRGDGTFDPNGNVTGYELGKMLLCALGYGANGEYTGKGWDFQVAIDGNKNSEVEKATGTTVKLSVFSNRASSTTLSAPATREEAALYCFNTIFLDQVTYNDVLKSYVSNKGFNLPATSIKDDVYPTLTGTVTTDAAGRPATKWTFKGQDVGTFEGTAAYVYTKSMKDAAGTKELETTFKNFTVPAAGAELKVDGAPQAAVTTGLADAIKAQTGNGTVVQVFVNPDKLTEVKNISVLHTELAQITNVNTVLKKVSLTTVTTDDYTVDGENPFYAALSAKAVGSYVLIRHLGPNVCYVAEPTVVTGKLTSIGKASGVNVSVTVKGGTYAIAEKQAGLNTLTDTALTSKTDVTLYLDTLGNAMYIKDVAVAANYMCVAKAAEQALSNGSSGVLVYMLSGYTPDGQLVTLNVGTTNPSKSKGDLVSYTACDPTDPAKNRAEYEIAPVTAVTKTINNAGGSPVTSANDSQLFPGHFALAKGSTDIKATDTMFEGQDTEGTPGAIKKVPYAPNVKFIFMSSEGVVVRDGVQNVTVESGADSTTNAIRTKALFGKTASGDVVVTAVYVLKAPGDALGSNLLFLTKATGYETVNGKPVFKYKAVIDGVETDIMSKTDKTAALEKFYPYGVDSATGLYSFGNEYTTDDAAVAVKKATFAGLSLGYILDIGTGFTDLNAKNAKVVDLTGKGLDTLNSIAKAAEDPEQTITLAVIFDGLSTSTTYKTVKYVYVVSAVTTTYNITAATQKSDGASNTLCKYDASASVASAAKGATVTVTVTLTAKGSGATGEKTVTITDGTTKLGDVKFKLDGDGADAEGATKTFTFTMPNKAFTLTISTVA